MPDETARPDDEKARRLAENLRPMQEASGVALPDETRGFGAKVFVGAGDNRPVIQNLIVEISDLLRTRGLYRREKDIGVVNEETGEFEIITPHAFCSWVYLSAGITPHKGIKTNKDTGKEELQISDLSVEQARLILQSHELRAKVPEILGVNLVPLPAFRDELDERGDEARKGFRKIELLRPGYDARTKIFTVLKPPLIDETLPAGEAADWLFNLFKTFDWSDKDAFGRSNRMGVHIACMLSIFCRQLWDGKAPFFLYHSNLEGSGKGALIQCALLPVFRRAGPDDIDLTDTKELRNVLNTKAASGGAYVWAEELPENWNLNDRVLARWATACTWEFRPMGQNKQQAKADITKIITLLGSNRMTVDRNLQRRILHADLFPHQEAKDRKLPDGTQLLDAAFFADERNLDKMLSAMWAIVKEWDDMGRRGPTDRLLESFEGWSRVIPGMVENCGLGRPLVEFVAAGAGDDDSRVMKALATKVIDAHCFTETAGVRRPLSSVVVTMRDIVRAARLNDMFCDRLGSLDQVLEDLRGKKSHKWREVEDVEANDLIDEDEATPGKFKKPTMREPNETEMRLQAAEFLDQAVGSAWGKFFKRMAVDERWFTSSEGVPFKFGDRGSSKTSRFVLRLMTVENAGGK